MLGSEAPSQIAPGRHGIQYLSPNAENVPDEQSAGSSYGSMHDLPSGHYRQFPEPGGHE